MSGARPSSRVIFESSRLVCGPLPTNSSRVPSEPFADLEEFVHDHRPHGPLTADASAPAWNGYQLTVACPCGVVFQRWVTPEDAELDLLHFASLT
jgi:hypothetical protein